MWELTPSEIGFSCSRLFSEEPVSALPELPITSELANMNWFRLAGCKSERANSLWFKGVKAE